MKYGVCFGDLVKVRGEWETAVRANYQGVTILTPPHPTMDGSANPGFRIRSAAVPGAIEALERLEMTAGQPAMDDDPVRVRARDALRAVRGEELA